MTIMKYDDVVNRMPGGVVELVESYVRMVQYMKSKNDERWVVFIGRIKGALEVMEEMDYITDDVRWALYRFYGIGKSETGAVKIER